MSSPNYNEQAIGPGMDSGSAFRPDPKQFPWAAAESGARGSAVGASARALDELSLSERMQLDRGTWFKLLLVGGSYLLLVALSLILVDRPIEPLQLWEFAGLLIPTVILLAFVFEAMDSAAGMGFGTALAPLLFALGYDPLAVTPVLLISEAITGLAAGMLHHEFRNVEFSIRRPLSQETRLTLLVAGIGVAAIIGSVFLTYLAIKLPGGFIETYVALLVLLMGALAIIRRYLRFSGEYRPGRFIAFAALAGFNKGVGGGGYGPVVTLGQIFSGVHEKSATAISSFAEGFVSIAGVLTFVAVSAAGVELDLTLLPSILAGSIAAAVISPYLVRVLPNRIFSYFIPLYAFALGSIVLVQLYGGA